MTPRETQRGITAIGFLLIATFLGVVGVGVLKLVPIFIDNYQVKGVLERIASDGSLASPKEIRDKFIKQLEINSIRSVKEDQLEIERVGSNFKVTLAYEIRTPYIGAIDFVVKFKNTAEVPTR